LPANWAPKTATPPIKGLCLRVVSAKTEAAGQSDGAVAVRIAHRAHSSALELMMNRILAAALLVALAWVAPDVATPRAWPEAHPVR